MFLHQINFYTLPLLKYYQEKITLLINNFFLISGPSESADQCSNLLQNNEETNQPFENEESERFDVRSINIQKVSFFFIQIKGAL